MSKTNIHLIHIFFIQKTLFFSLRNIYTEKLNFLIRHILILSTSVIGAEQFVRSMGILIGGYPNEIEMIDQLNQGMEVKLETSYIIYFICIGLVAAAGVWN